MASFLKKVGGMAGPLAQQAQILGQRGVAGPPVDPGAQRRAEIAQRMGAMMGGGSVPPPSPTGGGGPRGPFGGQVAMKGSGGFQALPQPAMAGPTQPQAAMAPAPSRAGLSAPSAPSPYGPAAGAGINPMQRRSTGQLAQQILGGGRGMY